MLLAMALLSSMDAVAKWLMEHSATSIQLLALRSVIISPCLIAFFYIRGAQAELLPTRPFAQGLRGGQPKSTRLQFSQQESRGCWGDLVSAERGAPSAERRRLVC